jgi:hypothetical protein
MQSWRTFRVAVVGAAVVAVVFTWCGGFAGDHDGLGCESEIG